MITQGEHAGEGISSVASPPGSSSSPMQCVPGISTPIRLVDGGAQVQCASNDGKDCLWGSCPKVLTGSKPFTMACPGWMGTNGISACALLDHAKNDEVLPYMNNTDLAGGDYHTMHLPAGTDPHQCAALCMQDPQCMVWVYVIRGKPAGSGDCIFKNGDHDCPSSSPHSKTQGLCTAGRGHEPIGHTCKPVHPPARQDVMPPVRILKGESLDVRSAQKPKLPSILSDLKSIYCRAKGRAFLSGLSFLTDRLFYVCAGPGVCRSSGGRDLHQWRPRGVHTRGS